MSDQTKLEPCPFCGGEAFRSSPQRDPPRPGKPPSKEYRLVQCGKCGIQTGLYSGGAEITQWNRRAPVAIDAAPESKLALIERPEGIPNLPSPGWHEAIRKLAIKSVGRRAYGRSIVHTGWTCELCKGDWEKDETEQHAPDCLAALLPPGGGGRSGG